MKPGGLRLEVGFPYRYGLLRPLRHIATTSTAGNPVLMPGRVTMLPVFIQQHSVSDLRFLLYAHKVQAQYPRIWPLTYTPIVRAVQSRRKPFRFADQNKPTQILTPSPSVSSVSKVRTLQTEVPFVTIVRLRLEVSSRDGVPGFIPVFPGLQTGSSSLSPACQVSLGVLGETSVLPAFLITSFPAIQTLLPYASRRAYAALG